MTSPGFLVLALLLPMVFCGTARQRAVEVSNGSEQRIVLDWYNPLSRQVVPFASVSCGESIQLNSFTNHTFVVRYDNDTCTGQYCRNSIITVSDNDQQGKTGFQIPGLLQPSFCGAYTTSE